LSWHDLLALRLLGNTIDEWAVALIAVVVTLTVLPVVRTFVAARRRRRLETQTEAPVAIQLAGLLIERTSRVFLWALALYLGLEQLTLPHRIERAGSVIVVLIFWFQVGTWAMAAVGFALDKRSHRRGPTSFDPTFAGSLNIIVFVSGLIVWTLALLLALENLGIAIQPLLAGLGIGGIAVALAVQNVLGDLFASMSIAFDKPFILGDFLVIETFEGTVEHIGVKSTRLRSISGEQIIMSNAELLKSRVRNYGRMMERRSAFMLNVTYDTSPDILRAIPEQIREIVQAQRNVRFDRCHLLNCAPVALQFEIVYFVLTSDFRVFADTQQAVNLAILELFRQRGIQFATPVLQPMPTRPESRRPEVAGVTRAAVSRVE